MKAIVFHIFVLFSYINCIEGINKVLRARDDPLSSFLVDDAVIKGHVFKEKIARVRRPDLATGLSIFFVFSFTRSATSSV
jgi:hypothetical protein